MQQIFDYADAGREGSVDVEEMARIGLLFGLRELPATQVPPPPPTRADPTPAPATSRPPRHARPHATPVHPPRRDAAVPPPAQKNGPPARSRG